jgi:hypothetical protein
MPRHAFENQKTQGGDATISDANEWNAAHNPITSSCTAVHTPGTAVPLTITVGASSQTLYVERCDITTDSNSDQDVVTVANGSLLGQTIDLVCVASTNSLGLTISATFMGGTGTTTYLLPWATSALVNTGMQITWDGSGWVINKVYVEYPHACIDFQQPMTTDPPAKAGMLQLYNKAIADRLMPKWIGPSGVDTPFQAFLGMNSIKMAQPGTATAPSYFGTTCTITGTATAQAMVADGTIKGKMRYMVIPTAATAAAAAGMFTPQYEAHRGGGFFFVARFSPGAVGGTIGVTQRIFVGLISSLTLVANSEFKTITTSRVGICCTLAASVGNFFICAGDGTATMTAIDLGSTNFAVTIATVIELVLYCAPGGNIGYRVTNMVNGAQVSGTLTANIPLTTQLLAVQLNTNNNATAAACNLAVNKWYLESDY